MAKRFVKPTINWKELQQRVPPEQMPNFLAFKSKADIYLARVNLNPFEPPKINWEHYSKTVPVKGMVDALKTSYEKFKVPYPPDNVSKQVDEQWAALQKEIKTFNAEQDKLIAAASKELDILNAVPKLEVITLEMAYDMYPDQALDPVKRPTFWPHTPEEQEGYVDPSSAKGH